MQHPRISVLLPCYNCAGTLPRALDSLLEQTLEDFEVLAVDDGSTDATPGVLEAYALRDDRIKPVRLPRSGIVEALNAGIALAGGEYLARMDGDDQSLPGRLALQAAYLDENPQIGLVGGQVLFGGDRRRCRGYSLFVDWQNAQTSPEAIRQNRFVECPLAHPSFMLRSQVIEQYGGYRQGPFPEDYELVLRLAGKGVGLGKVPEPILIWNDPPDRLSRQESERYGRQAFFTLKAEYLAAWLQANNPFHPEVVVHGSGRTARKRLALLEAKGIRVTAFVDIDPKKIGRHINGRPVWGPEELPAPGACFCLSYVAKRGGRESVEGLLRSKGYHPERDYLLVA